MNKNNRVQQFLWIAFGFATCLVIGSLMGMSVIQSFGPAMVATAAGPLICLGLKSWEMIA